MTQREFLTKVIEGTVTEAEVEFAKASIEKLDKSNAAKAAKLAEKRAAEAPIYETLVACLTDDPQTASDLAAQVEEITSTQEVLARLCKLVEAGAAVTTDLEVNGRTAKGYAKA